MSAPTEYFCGFAEFPLANLRINGVTIEQYRTTCSRAERKNYERLISIFEKEGCRNLEQENAVDVVLDDDLGFEIPAAFPTTYDQIPKVEVLARCLHGLHRLLAADSFFVEEQERSWLARVYRKDTIDPVITKLSETFFNEHPRLDGHILWKIRHYETRREASQSTDADELVEKWQARLSSTKKSNVDQLLRDKRYRDAFDALLSWQGLWSTIQIGSFHRLLTMKCHEEMLRYLGHVFHVWTSILKDVSINGPEIVDDETVRNLETLAPRVSPYDDKVITNLMSQGRIFSKISSAADRSTILKNLRGIKGCIPSLFTFFETLKYLEPCDASMRLLLSPGQHRSIKEVLFDAYTRPTAGNLTVEYGDRDVRSHRSSTELGVDREIGYQQLWLFVLRNWPELTGKTSRMIRGKGKSRPEPITPDQEKRQELGELAVRLGFNTTEAKRLQNTDGLRENIRGFVDRYIKPTVACEDLVSALASTTRRHRTHRNSGHSASRVRPLYSNKRLGKEKRCGRPFTSDHEADRASLYLPEMCKSIVACNRSSNITSFLSKRYTFEALFGGDVQLGSVEFDDLPSTPIAVDEQTRDDCNECAELRQINAALCTELQSQQEQLSQEMALLRSAKNEIHSELQAVQIGMHTQKEENAATTMKLRAEINSLQGKQQSYRDDSTTLNKLYDENTRLQGSRATQEATIEKLRAEIDRLNSETSLLKERNVALDKLREKNQQQEKSHMENFQQLQDELLTSQNRLKQSESEITDFNHRFESIRTMSNQLRDENDQLGKSCQEAKAQCVNLQAKIHTLETNVAEKDEALRFRWKGPTVPQVAPQLSYEEEFQDGHQARPRSESEADRVFKDLLPDRDERISYVPYKPNRLSQLSIQQKDQLTLIHVKRDKILNTDEGERSIKEIWNVAMIPHSWADDVLERTNIFNAAGRPLYSCAIGTRTGASKNLLHGSWIGEEKKRIAAKWWKEHGVLWVETLQQRLEGIAGRKRKVPAAESFVAYDHEVDVLEKSAERNIRRKKSPRRLEYV